MQNPDAAGNRRTMPANAAIMIEGQRSAAIVGYRIIDAEQVIFIDGNNAREQQALPIVPGKGDRGVRCQRLAVRRPDGPAIRKRHVIAILGPAELHEIGKCRICPLQQLDIWRIFILRFLIAFQHHIVETQSGQRNRATYKRRIDGDSRGVRNSGCLIGGNGRHGCSALCGCGQRITAFCIAGGHLFGNGLLAGSLPFQFRANDEDLPAKQHGHRQGDCQDQIAVF